MASARQQELELRAQRLALEQGKEQRRLQALQQMGATEEAAGSIGAGALGGGLLLWLVFGAAFIGIFAKLAGTIPFALLIGLILATIIIWRGAA